MTREDAIKELKEYEDGLDLEYATPFDKAILYAIQALSQEPCEDWYDVPSDEMTLEQARQAVKDLRKKLTEYLEQEPCDDAISRDAALEKMADYVASGYADSAEDFLGYSRIICQLPSVTQKSGWIPVSERLPEEETYVLICNGNGDIELSRGSYSTEVENYFIWYTSGWRFGEVIAWMPLPEPYDPQESEE